MASKISWTDETWNPVVGCTKCSPGCQNCYAERMACRLAGIEESRNPNKPLQNKYSQVTTYKSWLGNIVCDESALNKPLHWRKPRRIFVVSMGDLFHEKVPFSFIDNVFNTIEQCLQHTFQILTKRPKIALKWSRANCAKRYLKICRNVHFGVSISNQAEMWRADVLSKIPAAVKFISYEPLLENIQPLYDITYDFLDWVIIGCESINGRAGRFQDGFIEAAINLVRQCKGAGVPVFVKQIPRVGCRKCGFEPCTHLHGHRPKTFIVKDKRLFWPKELQVQEKPDGKEVAK